MIRSVLHIAISLLTALGLVAGGGGLNLHYHVCVKAGTRIVSLFADPVCFTAGGAAKGCGMAQHEACKPINDCCKGENAEREDNSCLADEHAGQCEDDACCGSTGTEEQGTGRAGKIAGNGGQHNAASLTDDCCTSFIKHISTNLISTSCNSCEWNIKVLTCLLPRESHRIDKPEPTARLEHKTVFIDSSPPSVRDNIATIHRAADSGISADDAGDAALRG